MTLFVAPHILSLSPYVAGKSADVLARELGLGQVIKLVSNENPRGPSALVREAMLSQLEHANRYPDGSGGVLRQAIANYHSVSPDEIILGSGSSEIIDLLCRVFADASHHGVVGTPSFASYRIGLCAARIDFTEVSLQDHIRWSVDDLLAAVKPETRLLFVANPNNPTGTCLTQKELEHLANGLRPDVLLVVDEAYIDFANQTVCGQAMDLRSKRENLVILRTFSKAHGLAGLRVGYGVMPAHAVSNLNRLRPPFNVSAIAQAAAVAALSDKAYLAETVALNQQERTRVMQGLCALGLTVVPSEANFLLVKTGPSDAKQTYDGLANRGVVVRQMSPPIADHLRVSIGLPDENTALLEAWTAIVHAKESR